MLLVGACGSDSERSTFSPPAVVATTTTGKPPEWEVACPGLSSVEVVYVGRVPTAGSGNFTLQTPSGTKQGDFGGDLKDSSGAKGLRFCFRPGDFVYLSVQAGVENGSAHCAIRVDGQTIASNQSDGDYVIAQCDGSSP